MVKNNLLSATSAACRVCVQVSARSLSHMRFLPSLIYHTSTFQLLLFAQTCARLCLYLASQTMELGQSSYSTILDQEH